MPHVIVKLWPSSEQQKRKLVDGVTKAVMTSLGYGEDAVSVSLEEVAPGDTTCFRDNVTTSPCAA